MKKLFFILMLTGCAQSAPITSAESAHKTIKAIMETIPAECKTNALALQFDALETQIKNINTECETKIILSRQKTKNWQLVALALGLVILLLLKKRF